MSRAPLVKILREKIESWSWLTIILGLYIFFALLFRSLGWGIQIAQDEQKIAFAEDLPQGGTQRIEMQVRFPERLFMSLPWFDSPPPQAITFFDFNVVNLQGAYTLMARLEPAWLWQVVDNSGNPISLEWTFAPGTKLPNSLTVYLRPVAGIQNEFRPQLEIFLDPLMGKQEKQTVEFVVESKFRAAIRRFILAFFGELTIFLSIFAFLSSIFWQYFQQKQQLQQQYKEKIEEINELTKNNLLNALEKIIQINKNELNIINSSLYQEIIDQIQLMPWELVFIRNIDESILRNDTSKTEKLLNELVSFQNILNLSQGSKKIDWKEVADLYRNLQTINLLFLDIVETIWKEFDIEARELIVELLIRFVTHHPEEKDKIKEKLKKTQNTRRLGHHPRIRAEFGELTALLRYGWLYHPIIAPNLSQNIQNWLNDRKNPFYPGRAEMESKETITQSYYFTGHLRAIIDEPQGMVWIQAAPGRGRTALSLYLAYQAGDKRFFPVRLAWDPAETGPLAPALMTAMAQATAGEWLKVLPIYPAALLDLPSSRQKEAMEFLQWALGHRDSLSAMLEKGRYTPEPGGPEVERGEEWQRQMRVLQNRLQRFLADAPTPSPPTPLQLREWLGLRPAGLEGTRVILELPRPLAESAYDEMWSLATALAEEEVYLRVIALNVPKPYLPVVTLRWTEEDLKAMLLARQVDRLFAASDPSEALDKLVTASRGLPRTMMMLGQLAITAHVERKPQERYLDEEDVEEAIKRYQSKFPQ